MGRFFVLLVLAAGVVAGPAHAPLYEGPDGLVVLAVVGREDSPSAVHGERVMVADPRTGETRARLLPGGTLCHGPLMAVGDRVVYTAFRGRRAVAMSLPLTLDGPPRSLGEADTITPSATPGRLWLGRWRSQGRISRLTLREVDLGGGADSLASGRLPRWSSVHAALAAGFVIGHGRRLALWDRGLDRPLGTIRDGWPVAAGASRFAWCGGECRSVLVWSRARERILTPPGGLRPQPGAGGGFSGDGTRLALPVLEGNRSRAAVIDLRTGDWSVVPGGGLAGYGALAWSPSGQWLYFAAADGRLHAWQPGARRAERLPVDPAGSVMSIATTG